MTSKSLNVQSFILHKLVDIHSFIAIRLCQKFILRYMYPGITCIVHGRKDQLLTDFESVLAQYEPMISATIRNLNIYRNHEQFRQAGRIAVWQAWQRYEEEKGHFAPYASRSIRGAMLDLLRSDHQFETHVVQTEDELLLTYVEEESDAFFYNNWAAGLIEAVEQLTESERELIQWFFVEGYSQAECAEKAKISVAGIKKKRERMLVKLKKILKVESAI